MRRSSPRGGVPSKLPAARVLCKCRQCVTHITVDPTGHALAGRYVGNGELKEHRQLESTSRRIDQAMLDSLSEVTELSPTPQVRVAHASLPIKLSPIFHRLRKADPFKSKIETLQRSLEDAPPLRALTDDEALVFSHPPSILSPPQSKLEPHSFALDAKAAANGPLLSREEWLILSRSELKDMRRKLRGILSLRATVLLENIEGQLRDIGTLKRQEWERRRVSTAAATHYEYAYDTS